MNINFKIKAIQNDFNHLFKLSAEELAANNIQKMIVNEKPGFPCRVSLEDAEIGEEVLLLPFEYHKTSSPYHASGPIFIRKNAIKANLNMNDIPKMLFQRQQTLRAYDTDGMMIHALTPTINEIKREIQTLFTNPKTSYIQIHNTHPGCYNCQVDRFE